MNCHDYEEQLGDYVDGTADARTRARVEGHLLTCARCSRLAGDFAAIRSMSRGLEPVTPSPQVWQAIAARTARSSSRRLTRGWLDAWQPVLASAVALLLGTGLWWTGARLSESTGATGGARAALADGFAADGEIVEAQYTIAIARLEEVTSVERTALDPVTADVLDAGLFVIDEAIDESRAALETEPDSELAQESLFAALRRKIAVLQEMLALINEMRQGNQDAAARILSELNQ
jgi:hypothetical protein